MQEISDDNEDNNQKRKGKDYTHKEEESIKV
jgi:hypothetical protein